MKRKWLLVTAILVIGSLYSVGSIYGCDLSDKEAINLTVNFCNKMDVVYSQAPWVNRTDHYSRVTNLESKDVWFGAREDYKITMRVGCNNKEVEFFGNWDIKNQVRKKYKISSITWEPHDWPPFLSESKAKEIILTIVDRIGLPKDAEFHSLVLDKEAGQWAATWIRKYNGFQYEKDNINIKIMAVDGEFFLYSINYEGKSCPTEIKVTKEKAIEAGLQEIWRLRGNLEKQKPNYEIVSAELKIVQPNAQMGKISMNFSAESRLAWVLVYELKSPYKTYCPQRMTIKIDSGTMEFLGGDFTRC
jgi:hypothetical protein